MLSPTFLNTCTTIDREHRGGGGAQPVRPFDAQQPERAVDAAVVLQQEAPDDGPGDQRHHHRREEQGAEHRDAGELLVQQNGQQQCQAHVQDHQPGREQWRRRSSTPGRLGSLEQQLVVPAHRCSGRCWPARSTRAVSTRRPAPAAPARRPAMPASCGRDEQEAGRGVAPGDGPERAPGRPAGGRPRHAERIGGPWAWTGAGAAQGGRAAPYCASSGRLWRRSRASRPDVGLRLPHRIEAGAHHLLQPREVGVAPASPCRSAMPATTTWSSCAGESRALVLPSTSALSSAVRAEGEELRQPGRVLRVGHVGHESAAAVPRSCPVCRTPMPAWPTIA